jgi:predicted GIY-YIG superfamily endonuclease
MGAGKQKIFIYGLLDKNDQVFYVGRTKNLNKRMSTYRSLNAHDNEDLLKKLKENGVRYVILRECFYSADCHEYEEIRKRSGLVNIIKDPRKPFHSWRPKKIWQVDGSRSPSTSYFLHMKNAFGHDCSDIKRQLKEMSDKNRMAYEMKLSNLLFNRLESVRKWAFGIVKKIEAKEIVI